MMRLRKILVPVDFSDESELAVEWAVKLGREEAEATIYLLNVLVPVPVMEGGMKVDSVVRAERRNARGRLEEWRRHVPPPLTSNVKVGEFGIVEDVLETCAAEDIDLVVMTTHGRRGLSRLAHPNLTERIVREAPCPVLVLHLNPKMEALAKQGA